MKICLLVRGLLMALGSGREQLDLREAKVVAGTSVQLERQHCNLPVNYELELLVRREIATRNPRRERAFDWVPRWAHRVPSVACALVAPTDSGFRSLFIFAHPFVTLWESSWLAVALTPTLWRSITESLGDLSVEDLKIRCWCVGPRSGPDTNPCNCHRAGELNRERSINILCSKPIVHVLIEAWGSIVEQITWGTRCSSFQLLGYYFVTERY